jgi:hypothetical protein
MSITSQPPEKLHEALDSAIKMSREFKPLRQRVERDSEHKLQPNDFNLNE